jgi:phage shock protein A
MCLRLDCPLAACCCSVLEGKLAEARSKKDTLKARAASAKTSKQVQEMMGSLNTSNAVVAFDKMEEKVRGGC